MDTKLLFGGTLDSQFIVLNVTSKQFLNWEVYQLLSALLSIMYCLLCSMQLPYCCLVSFQIHTFFHKSLYNTNYKMTDTNVNQEIVFAVPNAPIDNRLLELLKSKFSKSEQQLFVQNFCMYLNYDKTRDYVVDLDKVWQWMGFSAKHKAKDLLTKHFTENEDYKILLNQTGEKPQGVFNQTVENPQGGRPTEKIMLNIKTFKKLCMKANTKKASDIHDYYITMEETLQQYINETYLEREQQSKIEQKTLATNTLVENFHLKPVNYFGIVGMVDNQLLGKFGYTNDIKTRIADHRRDIGKHFGLDCILECEKNMTLEKIRF